MIEICVGVGEECKECRERFPNNDCYSYRTYIKGRTDAIDEFYKGLLELFDNEYRYGYLDAGDILAVYKELKEQGVKTFNDCEQSYLQSAT